MKYGYLAKGSMSPTVQQLRQATTVFRKAFGLKNTGLLDHETLELMEKPRCGVPDLYTPPNASK